LTRYHTLVKRLNWRYVFFPNQVPQSERPAVLADSRGQSGIIEQTLDFIRDFDRVALVK
jgi:hypothetical protein